MTALPPKASLTGPTVTQGQFKTALDTVNDYLTGLLGADGNPATARAALGVVNATAPTSAQVISALGFTPYSTTSAVGKVDKTGDTITGNLTMSGSATGMKLYIVKNAGLAGARDYNVSLVVDRVAETVRATLALRVQQSSDPEIGGESSRPYVDKDTAMKC